MASNEIATGDEATDGMKIINMNTNGMDTNEMATDDTTAISMNTNEMASDDTTANGMDTNETATDDMNTNGMVNTNGSNTATSKANGHSQGSILPNELWADIFSLLGGPSRIVGVAPDLDDRVPRPPVPPIAHINRQTRKVFLSIYVAISSPQLTRSIPPVTVYVHPDYDTMILGYYIDEFDTTISLVEAPIDPRLANKLQKVWLADRDISSSAGHSGYDSDVASRPVSDIDRFPLDELVYQKLEEITLFSEKYDWDLMEEDEAAYGFDVVFHAQTGLVLMNPVHTFQQGEWLNARSGGEDFNEQESFVARIKIDRSDDLSQIDLDSFEGVIKGKGCKSFDPEDDPTAGIECAPEMWRYNWQICIDYVKLRLT